MCHPSLNKLSITHSAAHPTASLIVATASGSIVHLCEGASVAGRLGMVLREHRCPAAAGGLQELPASALAFDAPSCTPRPPLPTAHPTARDTPTRPQSSATTPPNDKHQFVSEDSPNTVLVRR